MKSRTYFSSTRSADRFATRPHADMPSLRHRTLGLLAPSSRRVAPARSRCRHHRSAALQLHQTRRCLNQCDRLTANNVKLAASMRMEMSAYSKSTHLRHPEMIIAELVSPIALFLSWSWAKKQSKRLDPSWRENRKSAERELDGKVNWLQLRPSGRN